MSGTSAGVRSSWAQRRAAQEAERNTPGPNALPGRCSGCGAPVLLVNLRWVDRDVPMIHECARRRA